MTDDEIIRLAREAGDDWDHTLPTDREFLLRFAALVAAAELRRLHLVEQALERCKAVCDATSEMVTTEPDNLLRKGLAQALRGIANGFDKRRPWSRPDPLIMRTLRRAADELDKANLHKTLVVTWIDGKLTINGEEADPGVVELRVYGHSQKSLVHVEVKNDQ